MGHKHPFKAPIWRPLGSLPLLSHRPGPGLCPTAVLSVASESSWAKWWPKILSSIASKAALQGEEALQAGASRTAQKRATTPKAAGVSHPSERHPETKKQERAAKKAFLNLSPGSTQASPSFQRTSISNDSLLSRHTKVQPRVSVGILRGNHISVPHLAGAFGLYTTSRVLLLDDPGGRRVLAQTHDFERSMADRLQPASGVPREQQELQRPAHHSEALVGALPISQSDPGADVLVTPGSPTLTINYCPKTQHTANHEPKSNHQLPTQQASLHLPSQPAASIFPLPTNHPSCRKGGGRKRRNLSISDNSEYAPMAGGDSQILGGAAISAVAKEPKESSQKTKVKDKCAPSKASGGVPEPSNEYLAHVAAAPPVMTPRCRPLLVIFDLNGTLLNRKGNGKRQRHGESRGNGKCYTERLHAKTFLDYCKERFTVMVWSSATRPNVEGMCDELFPSLPKHLRWARDNLGLNLRDQKQNVQVYKRLTHVWQDSNIQNLHPFRHAGGQWDQTNTILIDDSKEKARSEPFNCITLPVFDNNKNERRAAILPRVHEYINVLACQEDVSRYIKHRPFKVEDHPPQVPHTALLPYRQYLETSEHERCTAVKQVWDGAYSSA